MIKIIKQGVLTDDKRELYRGTCTKCGCVVQGDRHDLMPVIGTNYPYFYICPTEDCFEHIAMYKSNMRVQEAV